MNQLLFELNLPKEDLDKSPQKKEKISGSKSINYACRDQIEFLINCLDSLIPQDHRVRDVWDFVDKMDLSCFHDDIKILSDCKGPRTTDPKIFMALWLYAILEGIASARHIARLCLEHHAYIWICGNVSINYHSLSDFRTKGGDKFLKILQESIAIMWKSGLFNPKTAAQDGTKVKANAGYSLFKTEKTLIDYLREANEYINTLQKEIEENPSALSQREKASKERTARERKERVEKAQTELEKYRNERIQSAKSNHNKLTQDDIDKMRASVTDPECRKMKMGDGGFRLAYNVQFATSIDKKVILGVDVVNTLDPGTLNVMMHQVKENLEKIGCPMPDKWLADSAYANKNDAQEAEDNFSEVTFYSPPTSTQKKVDPLTPRKNDNEAMKKLRARMGTDEAKEIFKKRASTAEFANAVTKNRGMDKFLVRGIEKVKNMAFLYAIAHNMIQYFSYCSHML
jgi:transposase